MSNQSDSRPDYLKDVLAKSAEARSAGRIGEALIWLNTAAVLDNESDRSDHTAPVNVALFQLVYDTALKSENLVIKCGNVTTTHGDWLAYGLEAIEQLVARIGSKDHAPKAGLTALLQGQFYSLFEVYGKHFDREQTYVFTTGAQATAFLGTVRAIRQTLAAQEDIKIDRALNLSERASLLRICVDSPSYCVVGFPLRFFSTWDKALFFIETAQALVGEMNANPIFAGSKATAARVTELQLALQAAADLTSRQDKTARASYARMKSLAYILTSNLVDWHRL